MSRLGESNPRPTHYENSRHRIHRAHAAHSCTASRSPCSTRPPVGHRFVPRMVPRSILPRASTGTAIAPPLTVRCPRVRPQPTPSHGDRLTAVSLVPRSGMHCVMSVDRPPPRQRGHTGAALASHRSDAMACGPLDGAQSCKALTLARELGLTDPSGHLTKPGTG